MQKKGFRDYFLKKASIIFFLAAMFLGGSCTTDIEIEETIATPDTEVPYGAVEEIFGEHFSLDDLPNYASQNIPDYIDRDNAPNSTIRDEAAILGRVLFYDVNLSSNNTVSCASCHQQSFAFSDDKVLSEGVNGVTGRHSMRLINVQFSDEEQFFWDERAVTLEEQSTLPIRDHAEMGFSGQNGDPDFNDLIEKLSALDYYQELFTFAYGDTQISEARMQDALSQFIRSIQSFDSKYDQGRVQAQNDNQPFPNFTDQENLGKQLFLGRPMMTAGVRTGGGIGCGACHQAPEFSIDDNSRNNGVITSVTTEMADLTNTRSPTLRDLFDAQGNLNSPMMHNGAFDSMEEVLAHYNQIAPNAQLDNRLANRGAGQNLNMTEQEVEAVVAFIKTLSGNNVYTDPKWSDPFE
ncbi:MAG: cytochrome c peroxidase [Bacteroidota bacterium]